MNDAPSSPHPGIGVETSSRHQGVEHWVGFWGLSTFSCLSCVVFSKPSIFIEYHEGRSSAAGSASSQMRHVFFFCETKIGKLFKHLTNQTTCAVPFFGGKWFLVFLFVLVHSSYNPSHKTDDPGWTFVDLPGRSLHQEGWVHLLRLPPQI